MDNTIQFGKYVALAYEIFTTGKEGDFSVFKYSENHPDRFVFGMEPGMIEGFMKHLEGLHQGDTFDFTLTPAEAFGEINPDMIVELEKELFFIEGEFDKEHVRPGGLIRMQTADGHLMEGLVQAVTNDKVTIDFNHQLAGETVKYSGKVLEVRDATAEELNPKHHHCDCGCDHDHHHGCDGCNGCD